MAAMLHTETLWSVERLIVQLGPGSWFLRYLLHKKDSSLALVVCHSTCLILFTRCDIVDLFY